MRLAYLILAHSNPDQLERLVKKLSATESDIYIHIDNKTTIAPFLKLKQITNVFFIKKRVNVHWGAFSIVQATLNGFNTIIESNKNYEYVNLLSGQDYPIQSMGYMNDFLKANVGKAFMEFYSIDEVWQEAIPRLNKYHLTNYHFPGNHLLQKWINKILPGRKLPKSMVAVGRSQWFTITGEHVTYIVDFLNKNPDVKRFFKLTWGPDELIFQTILFNSPFKETMVNNNLRYIDWSAKGVNPKTFSIEDAQIILTSDKLFARKFSNISNDPLLELIDNKRMAG